MHTTQKVTCDWLRQSGLEDEELLLEALLRRGFLAYRDDNGVWIGTGSHPEDIEVLRVVNGLVVEPMLGVTSRTDSD